MPGESANPINARTFMSMIDWRSFPGLAAWEATAARVREREEDREKARSRARLAAMRANRVETEARHRAERRARMDAAIRNGSDGRAAS